MTAQEVLRIVFGIFLAAIAAAAWWSIWRE